MTNYDRIGSNRKLNGQKAAVMNLGKEAVAEDEEEGRGKRVKTESTREQTPSTLRTMPSTRSQGSSVPRGTMHGTGAVPWASSSATEAASAQMGRPSSESAPT